MYIIMLIGQCTSILLGQIHAFLLRIDGGGAGEKGDAPLNGYSDIDIMYNTSITRQQNHPYIHMG